MDRSFVARRVVEDFLRSHRARFYCGDCLAWELDVPASEVNTAVLVLRSARMFEWDVNTCSLCRRERMVLRVA